MRLCSLVVLVCLGVVLAGPAAAAPPQSGEVLVLPFRSIGVSDTTIQVSRSLLENGLRSRGVSVAPERGASELPSGPDACDEPQCALALASSRGAGRVVYGTFSKLGKKVLVRVSAISAGASKVDFSDQLTAETEEDLDTVMRRLADAIASGRPNAERPTVQTVLESEARAPRLRASRSGLGFNAGFMFPVGNSYAGKDRLTNLHLTYKYERPTFLIESTTALGLTFGGGNVDWTILDLSAARIFGGTDISGYIGGGLGVHSIHLEHEVTRIIQPPEGYSYPEYTYTETVGESATAPSLDLVAGLLAMRTYDFEIVLEARYHHVFENFDKVGGKGAHGFQISIGTSR